MVYWVLIVALFVIPAAAETKLPPDAEELVSRARSLPPEFAAHLLLQVAESKLKIERADKEELIEEAYRLGLRAQWPHRRTGGVHTDTRQYRDAYDGGFDSLTLQTHAAAALLPLNPSKAVELFTEIRIPPLPDPGCEEALMPALSTYYKTVLGVFDRGFTVAQREKEEDILFVAQALRSVSSPAQVPHALGTLAELKAAVPRRQELLAALATNIDQISSRDRIFSANWEQSVFNSYQVRKSGLDISLLAISLRRYVVRHLGSERCAENLRELDKGELPHDVMLFNKLARELHGAGVEIEEISPEEMKRATRGAAKKLVDHWQSPRSREVMNLLKWLNHGNRNLPDNQRFWTLQERKTPEWNARHLELLKLIEGWRPQEEDSAEDYFYMKSDTYGSLASLIPPGPTRDSMLRSWLAYLDQSYPHVENRNGWFSAIDRFAGYARSSTDPTERAFLLGEMVKCPNPIISSWARAEQILGPRK